jgi:hypothetical protein
MTYDMDLIKYRAYPMNFWDYDNPAWSGRGVADMYHVFKNAPLPEVGMNTVRIHIDADDPSGGYFVDKVYDVITHDKMPTVAATKEVDGETKVTIGAKEKRIGLKVTWNDPPFKEIMKPGIQLRVYIGGDDNIGFGGHEMFYFIDCPAQLHKMLVTKDSWNSLKARLIDYGYPEARLAIIYRSLYDPPEDENGNLLLHNQGSFWNRGHSDSLTIPLF